MKINSLKINNFGKLQEKEIKFSNKINIIYGKNESGKSTLLKFIISIFYGLSKNKNGKEITDLEKYTPWEGETFSGKLKYELDNNNQYEIYREFKKKNPKIFNENLEDISEQFNIDKTKGNQFLYEQTKIDEELFLSTIVSEQEELKLNEKSQTTLVQKLSNIASTGEDNISFQKIINKLNKKQLEEIGTKRSQDRPINIIENKLTKLQQEKEILKQYQDKKYEIEEQTRQAIIQIEKKEKILKLQQEIKETKNKNEIQKEKINICKSEIEKHNKNILELNKEIEQIKIEKPHKNSSTATIISIIGIIISIITIILIKNNILKFIPTIFTIVYIIVSYLSHKKQKMCITKNNKEKEIQKEKIKSQIEILEHNKKEQMQQISKIEQIVQNNIEIQKQLLISKNNIELKQEIETLLNEQNIESKITQLQNEINETKLKIHGLKLDNENILLKLENMAEIEEQISELKEQYQELIQYNESITIAKQEIEKAYEEMKQNITPKFTNNLSKIIKEISNGKYNKVRFNDEQGIIVELENGNYIGANRLSIGTIEQLYLALRLSTVSEISEEKMPILLDEVFAYFDENRLENILNFLNQEFNDRQIFIFTCTNREKQILEKMKIEYNLVEM